MRRHYLDAAFLFGNNRVPNADHLAGFAAECGLKATLDGWYGATLRGRFLNWNGERVGSHVNGLWVQVGNRRILTPMALARRVRSPGSLVTTAAW